MSKKNAAASRSQRAAAAVQAQKDAERRRRMVVVGSVVAVLVLLVAGGAWWMSRSDTTGEAASDTPSGVEGYGVVVGDAEAPTTLTVYEDLQCPACASFEQQLGPTINDKIEQGEIKVDYRMVSFLDPASTNEYSSRALNAALVVLDTAGVDAFKEMHDQLYADQPAEGGPGHTDEELVDVAVAAGAEESAVTGPIEDKVYEQWITNATDQMSQDGVNGTPSFRIDGEEAEVGEVVELLQG